VYAETLRDPDFFLFLLRIDKEFADQTRRDGCRYCAGPLHVADFPRKPRGCPATVVREYSSRFSFTCGRCEQRSTSPSVRFLSRRVYVAVVLMLASPPRGSAVRTLGDRLNIPPRTILRWRKWWTEDFRRTPFWRAARSRFMPPIAVEQLPASLLERFDVSTPMERLAQALRFVSPMSLALMIK
jgi:hypothetical protein